MSDTPPSLGGHEPSLQTVELVCDRLAELGVAVGPDTARELVRAVLAAEAPRVDARLREALDTALETIRVAAQAAMGVLKTTSPATPLPRRNRPTPAPEARRTPARRRPEEEAPPPPAQPRRETPRPRDDFEESERRPMFRRPRDR